MSSQALHKSSLLRENFKITFKSVLGHIQFVLMLVLHFAESCDVASLLKWLYKAANLLVSKFGTDSPQEILNESINYIGESN